MPRLGTKGYTSKILEILKPKNELEKILVYTSNDIAKELKIIRNIDGEEVKHEDEFQKLCSAISGLHNRGKINGRYYQGKWFWSWKEPKKPVVPVIQLIKASDNEILIEGEKLDLVWIDRMMLVWAGSKRPKIKLLGLGKGSEKEAPLPSSASSVKPKSKLEPKKKRRNLNGKEKSKRTL